MPSLLYHLQQDTDQQSIYQSSCCPVMHKWFLFVIFTARSELCKVPFLAVCDFFVVHEISQEPLNG